MFGYGNGRHSDGHFRVDQRERKIRFGSRLAGKNIVMEYICTGVNVSLETVVHEDARKLVKLYVFWRESMRSRIVPMAEKEMNEQQYYTELGKALVRRMGITVDKIMAIDLKSRQAIPKATIYG